MNGPNTSDSELFRAAREGDMDAFGLFYRRHREMLLGYLARRTREPELAADLMAESFARALITVTDAARPLPEQPAPWLVAVGRNLLIDSIRQGRVEMDARRRLGLEPLELDDRDLRRIVDIAASDEALEALRAHVPAVEWQALRARVIEDEPYADLASRLGCSEALVRKRVSKARTQLRIILGGTHV